MFKNNLIVLTFCLLCTCTTSNELKNLPIPMEKLVEVMTDVYVVEAAIENYTPDIKDSLSPLYYQQVYEIHKVSEEDYKQSIEMVKYHPDIMDDLYSRINEHLLELEKLEE